MALFYGMITNLDDNMQRLFTALKATGQEEDTIVMFMTDNGSSLPHLVPDEYETLIDILPKEVKTQFGDTLTTLNANMRGAKASTYEGGHRVPFFIKWPGGHFTGAKEVTGLSAHFDVLPTLLDLAGIDAELDTDGMSFAPSLQKGEALPDRTLVVTNQRVLNPFAERPYSVMNGNWRYVHAEERGGIALFDLSKDPSQATDIAQQHPERVAEMAAAYSDWWKHTTSAGTPTTRPIVGTDHEPLMRLTGHDWLSPNTSQVAWWPGFEYEGDRWSRGWLNNEARYRVSPWALRVGVAGNYHFEILLHDKAAEKVIDKAFAHLELNGKLHTVELAKGSTSAVFTADLPLGELDVRAWFDDASDSSSIESGLPAFFLYVEQASETNE